MLGRRLSQLKLQVATVFLCSRSFVVAGPTAHKCIIDCLYCQLKISQHVGCIGARAVIVALAFKKGFQVALQVIKTHRTITEAFNEFWGNV